MFLTAIIFIAILSILVMIHEFGHYTVARFFGVHVEEFGFGLPPRIWGKKIKGTVYSVNWLPIGGFVKLAGEDREDVDKEKQKATTTEERSRYFWAKSRGQRALILSAGVFMNFLLAVVITAFLLTRGIIEQTKIVHIETISPNSPAAAAGLQEKDIVSSIQFAEGPVIQTKNLQTPEELIEVVKTHTGMPITLSIIRNGTLLTVTLVPRTDPPKGEGPLGVAVSNLEKHKYPLSKTPWMAVKINGERVWMMLSSLGAVIAKLVTGQRIAGGEIAGPIGIAQVTGQAVKYGFEAVLEFMSILSLNLAVLNILPFPALDGGRLVFVIADKFGKKARPAVERMVHQIGMIILLALILLVTVNDILRIVRG
ncbi:MAG: site-2 protease family protein [Candidatus Gottesmanbacteria bacterium]